ncbi:MAG: DDE-type integrase/transposase/recombinase, partial [Gammaproteobacteria bacterium]|nr:DDE-type integrase/transposase/recombinase [Gammaproteobacteria bacterium]
MVSFGASATTGRRIQRWFDRLRHYDYTVKHIAGKYNILADFLSRIDEDGKPSDDPTLPDDDNDVTIAALTKDTLFTPEELLEYSTMDKLLARVCQYIKTGWPKRQTISNPSLRRFIAIRNELLEWNGIIFRGNRLIIPEILQPQILERLHSGHPGIVRMKQLYRESYFWICGSKDFEEFVESCQPCAASEKSSKTPEVPTGEFPPPDRPWERVLAIDITGPFWYAPRQQEYIVVLMDYFSNWPEILITGNTTSFKIITSLEEVFAAWGNPLELVSDNGPQFTSHEFTEFLASHAIKHNLTPVYCPQRNGLIERFNRVLKSASQVIHAQGSN